MKNEKYIFAFSILILIIGLSIVAEVNAENFIGVGTKGKDRLESSIGSGSINIIPSVRSSNVHSVEIDPRQRPEEVCIRTTPKLNVHFHNNTINLFDSTSVDVYVQNKDSYSCLASEFNISMVSNTLETSIPTIRTLMPGETIKVRMGVGSGNLAGDFTINTWAKRDLHPSEYNLSRITVLPDSPNNIIITPFYAGLEYGEYINFNVFGYDEYSNYIEFEEGELTWSSTIGHIYQNGTFYANETGEGKVFAQFEEVSGEATIVVSEDPCDRSQPSIVLYPLEDSFAVPNQEVQIIAEITNNDNLDCVRALFKVNSEINLWELENEEEFILLESGETKNITINLTAPLDLGTETLLVNVSHFVDESLSTYAEKDLTTIRAAPTNIKLIPENTWVPAGLELYYEVIITDEFGNYYNVDEEGILTWETNAGTIENGVLTPLYAGNKYVKAIYELDGTIIEGITNIEVRPTRLSRIEIIPNTETVEVNSIVSFTAFGYDEFDNSIEINPIWNTTAGEIEGGIVNATNVGTHEVTAELTYKTLVIGRSRIIPDTEDNEVESPEPGLNFEEITITGTADLIVTPGPYVYFEVIPNDFDLNVGETRELRAVGYDELGNPIEIDATWRIGAGTGGATLTSSLGSTTIIRGTRGGSVRIDVTYLEELLYVWTTVYWTPPTIQLLNPENILLNTGETIRLNITDSDGIDYATYKIDSGLPIHISAHELPIYEITIEETGRKNLEVYAKDNLGSQRTRNFDILITDLPIINLISHTSGDTLNVGDILEFNMSDEYFTFEYQWNDLPLQSFDEEYQIIAPELYGENELTVYAYDTEGLEIILEEHYTFNLQQAPIIILNSPIEGSRIVEGTIIDFSITDPDGIIVQSYYSWNGGYNIVFTEPYNVIVDSLFLLPDENILTVYARDNEGLETEIDFVFFGENTLPTIEMDPVNGSIITEGDNVTAYMEDPTGLQILTYNCPIEGLQTIDLEGNLTANHILNCTWINGENTLEIIVYDIDGDNIVLEYTIYYDVEGPIIELISPVEGSVITQEDILVFNITDLNEIIYASYFWNDEVENLFEIDYNVTVPDLPYGENNITIYAIDSLGYETTKVFVFERVIETGKISGRVWSMTSGEPLENALVEIDGYPELDVFSNETGHYILEGINPGMYNLKASKEGYTTQEITGIGVVSDYETSEINFYLSEYGKIEGIVTDWFGNPIGDAEVKVYLRETVFPIEIVLTNEFGFYEIDELSAGWYDVEATKEGYLSARITNRPVIPGETTIVNLLLD